MWFLWALWYMVTWKRVEVVVVFVEVLFALMDKKGRT